MRNYMMMLGTAAAMLVATAAPAQPAAPTPVAGKTKPGYMIVLIREVQPRKMSAYASKATPLLLRYGGKMLFAADQDPSEVVEGQDLPGKLRVFEFPSLQSARDFWNSPEYREAAKLREGFAKIDVILIDAFTPDPKWFKK